MDLLLTETIVIGTVQYFMIFDLKGEMTINKFEKAESVNQNLNYTL